jgi:hypothetical protein
MVPKKLAITIYEAPEDTFFNRTTNNLPPDWKESPTLPQLKNMVQNCSLIFHV